LIKPMPIGDIETEPRNGGPWHMFSWRMERFSMRKSLNRGTALPTRGFRLITLRSLGSRRSRRGREGAGYGMGVNERWEAQWQKCIRKAQSQITKDFRVIESSRQDYHPYGKRDWIKAIRNIHKRGESVFARDLQTKRRPLYHQGIWIFGDWDKALRAAGFVPEKMRRRRYWDKDSISNEVRRMRKQNLPLYARYVMKNRQNLFSVALRQYGSWDKALAAAGIAKDIPRKSRLGVLRKLREAVDSKGGISAALRIEIDYYFGSFRKAKIALTNDPRL